MDTGFGIAPGTDTGFSLFSNGFTDTLDEMDGNTMTDNLNNQLPVTEKVDTDNNPVESLAAIKDEFDPLKRDEEFDMMEGAIASTSTTAMSLSTSFMSDGSTEDAAYSNEYQNALDILDQAIVEHSDLQSSDDGLNTHTSEGEALHVTLDDDLNDLSLKTGHSSMDPWSRESMSSGDVLDEGREKDFMFEDNFESPVTNVSFSSPGNGNKFEPEQVLLVSMYNEEESDEEMGNCDKCHESTSKIEQSESFASQNYGVTAADDDDDEDEIVEIFGQGKNAYLEDSLTDAEVVSGEPIVVSGAALTGNAPLTFDCSQTEVCNSQNIQDDDLDIFSDARTAIDSSPIASHVVNKLYPLNDAGKLKSDLGKQNANEEMKQAPKVTGGMYYDDDDEEVEEGKNEVEIPSNNVAQTYQMANTAIQQLSEINKLYDSDEDEREVFSEPQDNMKASFIAKQLAEEEIEPVIEKPLANETNLLQNVKAAMEFTSEVPKLSADKDLGDKELLDLLASDIYVTQLQEETNDLEISHLNQFKGAEEVQEDVEAELLNLLPSVGDSVVVKDFKDATDLFSDEAILVTRSAIEVTELDNQGYSAAKKPVDSSATFSEESDFKTFQLLRDDGSVNNKNQIDEKDDDEKLEFFPASFSNPEKTDNKLSLTSTAEYSYYSEQNFTDIFAPDTDNKPIKHVEKIEEPVIFSEPPKDDMQHPEENVEPVAPFSDISVRRSLENSSECQGADLNLTLSNVQINLADSTNFENTTRFASEAFRIDADEGDTDESVQPIGFEDSFTSTKGFSNVPIATTTNEENVITSAESFVNSVIEEAQKQLQEGLADDNDIQLGFGDDFNGGSTTKDVEETDDLRLNLNGITEAAPGDPYVEVLVDDTDIQLGFGDDPFNEDTMKQAKDIDSITFDFKDDFTKTAVPESLSTELIEQQKEIHQSEFRASDKCMPQHLPLNQRSELEFINVGFAKNVASMDDVVILPDNQETGQSSTDGQEPEEEKYSQPDSSNYQTPQEDDFDFEEFDKSPRSSSILQKSESNNRERTSSGVVISVQDLMQEQSKLCAEEEVGMSQSTSSVHKNGLRHPDLQSSINEWDHVQTIVPEIANEDAPRQKPRGGQGEIGTSTFIVEFPEALEYFKAADLSQYQSQIKPVIERRGLAAIRRFLFGPPKLHQDLIAERDLAFCLAACPLENSNTMHMKVLQTIYKKLTGSKFDCPRLGGHWEIIGFQGNDPSTDLRGTGFLALLHLLFFLTDSKLYSEALDIYKLSLHQTQNFPFCLMSINMTRIALQVLRQDGLNRDCNRQKLVMLPLAEFYVGIFSQLAQTWKMQNKTIADSGFVLKDLENWAKKNPKAVTKSFQMAQQSKSKKTTAKIIVADEPLVFMDLCKD